MTSRSDYGYGLGLFTSKLSCGTFLRPRRRRPRPAVHRPRLVRRDQWSRHRHQAS